MSDKIRETLADAFAAYPGAGCDWDSFWNGWKAALTQQPAPEAQKPAAWEVSSFGGRVDRIVVREDVAQELASNLIQRDAKDVRIRPLYAAPPDAEQPDTVPVPRALQADDRVPDDFRNQASGYRAGWNDCLAALLARRAYEPA